MTEIEIWRHYVAIQGNASPGFSSGASRGCRVPSPPRPAPEAQGGTTKVSGSQTSYFKDTLRL